MMTTRFPSTPAKPPRAAVADWRRAAAFGKKLRTTAPTPPSLLASAEACATAALEPSGVLSGCRAWPAGCAPP